MGFASWLTLLLVAAKLFGFAHYGWLVAFSPVLAGIALITLISIASVSLALLGAKPRHTKLDRALADLEIKLRN